MSIASIRQITKSYGKVNALDHISVEIGEGEIFGFIGPDGAGKTTLFRILTSLIKPDEGTAEVLGKDVVEDYRVLRPMLGYMPGHFSLYLDLSVQENLNFFASVFGTTAEENYDLIEPVFRQLDPFRSRLAGNLSGGMKQKLALSCALIHRPELLVLDEPTTGVDAVSRGEFWDMLARIRKEGITVIVSTPYMDEAERCDRVALIQEGALLDVDTPASIVGGFAISVWAAYAEDRYGLLLQLRNYPGIRTAYPFGNSVHVTAHGDALDLEHLRSYLADRGLREVTVRPSSPDIEDVFINLMEHGEASHAI